MPHQRRGVPIRPCLPHLQSIHSLRVPFLLRVRAGVAFHPDLAGPAHVQRRRAVAERDFGAVVEGVGRALEGREEVRVLAGKGAGWPVGLVIGELG